MCKKTEETIPFSLTLILFPLKECKIKVSDGFQFPWSASAHAGHFSPSPVCTSLWNGAFCPSPNTDSQLNQQNQQHRLWPRQRVGKEAVFSHTYGQGAWRANAGGKRPPPPPPARPVGRGTARPPARSLPSRPLPSTRPGGSRSLWRSGRWSRSPFAGRGSRRRHRGWGRGDPPRYCAPRTSRRRPPSSRGGGGATAAHRLARSRQSPPRSPAAFAPARSLPPTAEHGAGGRPGPSVRPSPRRAEQEGRGGAGRPGRAEVTLLCRGSGRALRPSVPRLEWRLGLGRRSGGFLAPRPREGVREAGSCRGFELGPDDGL